MPGGGPQRVVAHARSRGEFGGPLARTARLEIAPPRCGPPLHLRDDPSIPVNPGEISVLPFDESSLDGERRRGDALAGPSETARRGPAARIPARWAARGEARGGLRSKPDPCPVGASPRRRLRAEEGVS